MQNEEQELFRVPEESEDIKNLKEKIKKLQTKYQQQTLELGDLTREQNN
jgi:hypothetical protein